MHTLSTIKILFFSMVVLLLSQDFNLLHAQALRQLPDNRPQMQLSFAPIVQKTSTAVVNVYGARVEKRTQNPFMDDPFFRRFFGNEGFGLPQERVKRSLGSGVIVDASGLVVTNYHVIEGMTEVKVALADKREFEAEIILRDPRTDLAVLRLKKYTDLAALELGDSDNLQVGDLVLAIGNPFGVGQTVTQGIVSALARTQVGVADFQSFIQTDAAINPGNSGGALVDMAGRLIGINTAIFSKSGGSHGIGFAIPASMVKVVVDSAKSGSRSVRRPWFGARLQGVTSEIAESLGLDRPTGVLVAGLNDKSPAVDAGIKRGDVVLAVDGVQVDDPDAFGYRFATRPLGGVASLSVMRGKSKILVPVKLAPPAETRSRDVVILKGRSPLAGVTALNLSPAVADELALEIGQDGVVISDVDEASTAARVGFRKGDVIIAINRDDITTTKELEKVISVGQRYWEITINRGGRVFTSAFGD
jgi:Do/DeqQ family serine protease